MSVTSFTFYQAWFACCNGGISHATIVAPGVGESGFWVLLNGSFGRGPFVDGLNGAIVTFHSAESALAVLRLIGVDLDAVTTFR